jgi:hypothetical protein
VVTKVKKVPSGEGVDYTLPSKPPFMYIEEEAPIRTKNAILRVMSFGAYNAMGLIGTEKGGVGVALEGDEGVKCVVATKDIPWDMPKRASELKEAALFIRSIAKDPEKLIPGLEERGYDIR